MLMLLAIGFLNARLLLSPTPFIRYTIPALPLGARR